MPRLYDFIDAQTLSELIETARLEDLGPESSDITSACFIPQDAKAAAHLVPRQAGVIAGLAVLGCVCEVYGGQVEVTLQAADGDPAKPGTAVATLAGPLRDVLAIERVALNLLTHLSGITTLTAQYAARCAGTRAKVYDTRKTLPGLRGLQKYAVACGGGATHRIGLYDAMLIKDNHLAGVELDDLAARLTGAATQARQTNPNLKFVEVEVDTLEQLEQVLKAEVDIVLLDNMGPAILAQAVSMRTCQAPHIELEASGGISLDTVSEIAQTGVDRISIGALTHSAPSLDIGLDIH